eukprot:TRINITY_DN691_c0_g1_i1.p1 TRINITY_DN691_c0_g1~~TRINITY_DN691_c0_g1_i1.p1  ORF type:complete len:603 (+),score=145.61 TRINITY_DN691_c0_g1_i1:150-1958(+)
MDLGAMMNSTATPVSPPRKRKRPNGNTKTTSATPSANGNSSSASGGGGGGGVLSDILGNMALPPEASSGRNSVNPDEVAVTVGFMGESLHKCATEALHSMEGSDSGKLEVEARLGKFQQQRFHPGTTSTKFQEVRALLEEKGFTCRATDRTDYIYPSVEGQSVRFTCDTATEEMLEITIKQRITDIDLNTPQSASHFSLDCRLSMSSETECELPDELADGWIMRRRKQRFSYDFKTKGGETFWVIDMTIVDNVGTDDPTQYEIEFELLDWVVMDLNKLDRAKQVAQALWDCYSWLNCPPTAPSHKYSDKFPNLPIEQVVGADLEPLRQACWSVFPEEALLGSKGSKGRTFFPGALPVALSRRHFPRIQSNDYFVSEKTDGVRFILFLAQNVPNCSAGGAFLVDRNFDFYRVEEFDELVTQFGEAGATVLDGEMLIHASTQRLTFLVFDMYCFQGRSTCSEKLSERLKGVRDFIGSYRQAFESGSDTFTPFRITGKAFQPKQSVERVFNLIKLGQDRHWYYQDKSRHHKTDGIILTPDEPYSYRFLHDTRPETLFKWKFLDLCTIDFQLGYSDQDSAYTGSCNDNRQPVNLVLFRFLEKDRRR